MIIIIICIAGIFITLNKGLDIVSQYADYIYYQQIDNTKSHNGALLFQLNNQFQKMSWQLNLLNQFHDKVINQRVKQNPNYLFQNNILNIDRAYENDEEQLILDLFRKNKLLTSSWHTPSIAYIDQLDPQSKQQLQNVSSLDSIWRAIVYDNNLNDINNNRKLKFRDIFVGFDYDGMIFMTAINTTYQNMQLPPGCVRQKYVFDVRCRYYYEYTKHQISLQMFQPNLIYTDGDPFIASVLCQKLMKTNNQNTTLLHSIICNDIDLTQIPEYFYNFNKDSSIQIVIDPNSLEIIYHSQIQTQRQQIFNLQNISLIQSGSNQGQPSGIKIQDEEQQERLIQFIQNNYQNWNLNEQNSINMIEIQDNQDYLKTYEINFNDGSQYFVVMNVVKLIDKIPSYEIKLNNIPKYQTERAILYMNILSKEVLTKDMTKLKVDVTKFFIYFTCLSIFGFVVILLFIILKAIIISQSIIKGVKHLTKVLSKIKWETSEEGNIQFQDLIETNLNIQSIFQSKEMQILYESFQNLFKTLHYTTSNIYSQSDGHSLLNLNMQLEYFDQFKNFRALGVCQNNIGNIHYNSGRYFEAMESYQKAIICSNYDLGLYKDNYQSGEDYDGYQGSISQSSKRKGSLYKYECRSEKSDRSDKEITYWNHFNRKMNYLKAFLSYLNENNQDHLWICAENLVDELIQISKTQLFNCYSRQIVLLYYKSITLFKQGKIDLYEHNYNKGIKKYNKYLTLKCRVLNSFVYQPSLILNSPPFKQYQTFHSNKQFQLSPQPLQNNNQVPLLKQANKQLSHNQLNASSNPKIFSPQAQKEKTISCFTNARITTYSLAENQPKTLADLPNLVASNNLNDISQQDSQPQLPQNLDQSQANCKFSNHKSMYQQQQYQYSSNQLNIKSTNPSSLNQQKSTQPNSQCQLKSIQSKNEIVNISNLALQNNNEINLCEEINLQNTTIINMNDLNQKITKQNTPISSVQNLNEIDKKIPNSNIKLLLTQEQDFMQKKMDNISLFNKDSDLTQINQMQQNIQMSQCSLNQNNKNQAFNFNAKDLNNQRQTFLKRYKSQSKNVQQAKQAIENKEQESINRINRDYVQRTNLEQIQEGKIENREKNIFQKFKEYVEKFRKIFSKKNRKQEIQISKVIQVQDIRIPQLSKLRNNQRHTIQNYENQHVQSQYYQKYRKSPSSNLKQQKKGKNVSQINRNRSLQSSKEKERSNSKANLLVFQNNQNNSRKNSKQVIHSNFNNSFNQINASKSQKQGSIHHSNSHSYNSSPGTNQNNLSQKQKLFFLNQKISLNQEYSQKSTNTQISKIKKNFNDEQISRNIFPQCILDCFLAIQQSELMYLKGEYYKTAQLLTQQLQDEELYLQHLRHKRLLMLQKIFSKADIQNIQLNNMIKNQMQNHIFKIQFISNCSTSQSHSRVFELLNDIFYEILKQNQDQLGLITYNYDEKYYCQELKMTQYNQLKLSHSSFIDDLFMSVFQEQESEKNIKSEFKNLKITKCFVNNSQYENGDNQLDPSKSLQIQPNNYKDYNQIQANSFEKDCTLKQISKNKTKQLHNNQNESIFEFLFLKEDSHQNDQQNGVNQEYKQIQINSHANQLVQNQQTLGNTQIIQNNVYNTSELKSINQLYDNQKKLKQFQNKQQNQEKNIQDLSLANMSINSDLLNQKNRRQSNMTPLNQTYKDHLIQNNCIQGYFKDEEQSMATFKNQKSNIFNDFEDLNDQQQLVSKQELFQDSFSNNLYSPIKIDSPFLQQKNQMQQIFFGLGVQDEKNKSFLKNQTKTQINEKNISQVQESDFIQAANLEQKKFYQIFDANSKIDSARSSINFQESPKIIRKAESFLYVQDGYEQTNKLFDQEQKPSLFSKQLSQQQANLLENQSQMDQNEINSNMIAQFSGKQQIIEQIIRKQQRINSLQKPNPYNLVIEDPQQNQITKNISQEQDESFFNNINESRDDQSLSICNQPKQQKRQNQIQDFMNQRAQPLKQMNINLKQLNQIDTLISNTSQHQLANQIELQSKQFSFINQVKNNLQKYNGNLSRRFSYQSYNQKEQMYSRECSSLTPNRNKIYQLKEINRKNTKEIEQHTKYQQPKKSNENFNLPQSPCFLPFPQNIKCLEKQNIMDQNILKYHKNNQPHINKQSNKDKLFHLGMQKAIVSLLQPNDENQTYNFIKSKFEVRQGMCKVAQKNINLKNKEENLQHVQKQIPQNQFTQQYLANQASISVKKFIIFATDQNQIDQSTQMYSNLCEMLYNSEIELLILQLNSQDSVNETSIDSDSYFQSKCVIKFFFSSNKLLQYIYSQRSNFNVNLLPLIIEHFQTTFMFVLLF
ncbi:hypothetical protein ABPG74_020484 [Tetrahymena malaccensis]